MQKEKGISTLIGIIIIIAAAVIAFGVIFAYQYFTKSQIPTPNVQPNSNSQNSNIKTANSSPRTRSDCESEKSQILKDSCYSEIARTNQDETICEYVALQADKNICYRTLAILKQDVNLCNKIVKDPKAVIDCYNNVKGARD